MTKPLLNNKYTLARCCAPTKANKAEKADKIVGYFSFDDLIKVHRADCANLKKAEPSRLVQLQWNDILQAEPERPAADYNELDATDFAILKHHQLHDIDYSLMVAKVVQIEKQDAFDRHQKLRNLGLVERVDALMVRYRKKTAKNKWIKHRNHTYYTLTDKGIAYLQFHTSQAKP